MPVALLATPARYGWTLLTHAAEADNTEACRLLLEAGVDVNARDGKGCFPLLRVADDSRVDDHATIPILLSAGADPNMLDAQDECSPLICAASWGHAVDVRRLLEAGADPNLGTQDGGNRPIHMAAKMTEFSTGQSYAGVLESLLRFDADVDAIDERGRAPLHHAVYADNREAVRLLVLHGADIHVKSPRGKTVLEEAVACNRHWIADWLRSVT